MNKQQFESLEKTLYDRGYRKYNQHWHHEDYVIGKSFHKNDNRWEENRSAYQILICVYDYSPNCKFYDRLPPAMRNRIGLEVHVDMSRTIDERLELCLPFHDDDTIKEIERIAEGYFHAMCLLLPKPREEKSVTE